MNKIILLGYMGSGKSVVAELLARKIGFPFKDLDEIIEWHENLPIKNIFEQKGEIYFRKLEHTLFKELIFSSENFVLALGGGTPCYANNHKLLKGQGIASVYLKASLDELYGRLVKEKADRPLIAAMDEVEMKEFIAKHLFERSYFYNQAGHVVTVDHKLPEEIVSEIESLI